MNFDNYQIDKNSPVPLYYQVKKIILDKLNNNSIKPDDPLPPEEVLCDIFDVSRTTIRKAILELVNEGYLYRVRSKGTFVAQPKIRSDLVDMYGGYNFEVEGLNMIPYMKVINREIVKANRKIAGHLQLSEQEEVLSILRYRYADKIIMAHIESYLKYPLCDFVTKERLESSSMYDILASNELTKIKKVHRTIETCYANKEEIKLMKMAKGGLINLCTNVGYSSKEGEPIIYEIVKYRGDKIKYSIDIYLD